MVLGRGEEGGEGDQGEEGGKGEEDGEGGGRGGAGARWPRRGAQKFGSTAKIRFNDGGR